MRTPVTISALVITLLAATLGCKQTYLPPIVKNPPVNLVVEGFINNGPDSTYFNLSTTYLLSDSTATTPITGATVTVEGADNSEYPLSEIGNGVYGAPLPPLNTNNTYRLHISTTDDKEYASDYVPIVNDPPLDSINFIRNNSGVHVYANTHDPTGASQYYRYKYEEVWKFQSPYAASLIFANGMLENYAPDTTAVCWYYDNSTAIILAASTQLSKAVIYEAQMVNVPLNAQQISIEYSIFVHQYAVTKAAFDWWTQMQSNTENIGSIFGVQPSADPGNLHCLTDSTQQVIGYVSAGTIQSQRFFITNQQVLPWFYNSGCMEIQDAAGNAASQYAAGVYPVDYHLFPGILNYAYKTCVDCTLTGTNKKPSFWPN
jgi:Domain of unknown function (DUF4249)